PAAPLVALAAARARRAVLKPRRETTTATASEAMPTPPTIKLQGPLSITAGFQDPCSWPVKIQPPVSVTTTPTALAMAPAIEAAQKTPTGTSCSRLNSSGYFERMTRTSVKRNTIDRHQITVTAA